jgi:hypothetical protein
MAQVKGSAVTSRIRYIRDHADEDVYREVKAELSPANRAALEKGVRPHEWVPYSLFIEMNIAADELLGVGDFALCREMGRYGAKINLPTLYRIFMRLGSVGFILKKASKLWSVHYDSGTLEIEEIGKNAARLTIRDFDAPHKAHCLSVLGWAEGAIELAGSRVVRAVEEQCRTEGADACRFYAEWE